MSPLQQAMLIDFRAMRDLQLSTKQLISEGALSFHSTTQLGTVCTNDEVLAEIDRRVSELDALLLRAH